MFNYSDTQIASISYPDDYILEFDDDDWEDEDYCDECGEHYDDCYCHLGFNDD